MSYYRGLEHVSGAGASPYINDRGEWAILGHSLGVRAKGQLCQITADVSDWGNTYVETKTGYHTVESDTINLPENTEVTSVKLSGTTVSEVVNNTENLNGTLVGAVIRNNKIVVIQKGSVPTGQVTIDVYLDSFIKTGIE